MAEEININFVPNEPPRRANLFFVLKIVGAMLGTFVVIALIAASAPASEQSLLSSLNQIPFVKRVAELIHSADRPLTGTDTDRVNVLLLGIGGAGHDGPYLSDTIMLASLKPSTGQVALISIPRDLAVPIPGHGWYKVNAANAFGEELHPGEGGETTRTVLEQTLGVPIPYYVRIDFSGFETFIDQLGGVDVDVPRAFIDNSYPSDEAGNVKTISFTAGTTHMDGATALMFARSRHGSNGEGSDFARAHRQQLILLAVKAKVLSLGTLRSPTRISAEHDQLHQHLHTNFSPWEVLNLARIAANFDSTKIVTSVLDDRPGGLLVTTTGIDGAFLLAPRGNDWGPVQAFVRGIFSTAHETIAIKPPDPVRIEIQNGTHITGLAAQAATRVRTEPGFTVTRAGNASERERETTTIIDFTNGHKPDALRSLLRLFPYARTTNELGLSSSTPSGSSIIGTPTAEAADHRDFLIILGTDAYK